MAIAIHEPALGQSAICESILRALPEWFGIESATAQYIQDIAKLPTLVAWDGDTPVGFLALTHHYPTSAEIHVLGVLPDYHRQGIGRSLLQQIEAHLKTQGVLFLQVKTLSTETACPFYAKTRQFYTAMGFHPLEVWPTLWGEHNPCLQMIKWLGS
ncbi:MAG: GNAT family N-acetyltransferase [Leptolyngbya sp. SIOISBB]|nr:GNAT family N-acetyltransferase [Leptolyngbya sp. SIOISBB]